MDEVKLEVIIDQIKSEIENIRERINSNETIICTHVVCDSCTQRSLEMNAFKDALMIQLREKEEFIQRLQT